MRAQLQRKGSPFATLRATPQMLMLRKTFRFTPPKMSFSLHTMAGVTYEGARLPAMWVILMGLYGL